VITLSGAHSFWFECFFGGRIRIFSLFFLQNFSKDRDREKKREMREGKSRQREREKERNKDK
jgi:hypothetical protein